MRLEKLFEIKTLFIFLAILIAVFLFQAMLFKNKSGDGCIVDFQCKNINCENKKSFEETLMGYPDHYCSDDGCKCRFISPHM